MKIYYRALLFAAALALILSVIQYEKSEELTNVTAVEWILYGWCIWMVIFIIPIILGLLISILLKKIKK